VRVFSRTGHEWSAQLPAIAAALRALPVRSVILDGEGVICGPDGVSDFDRMRAVFRRKGSSDVFLYAFDVLELDGRDLRAQRWDEPIYLGAAPRVLPVPPQQRAASPSAELGLFLQASAPMPPPA
jgi:ATP dependent DNA ligase domain